MKINMLIYYKLNVCFVYFCQTLQTQEESSTERKCKVGHTPKLFLGRSSWDEGGEWGGGGGRGVGGGDVL